MDSKIGRKNSGSLILVVNFIEVISVEFQYNVLLSLSSCFQNSPPQFYCMYTNPVGCPSLSSQRKTCSAFRDGAAEPTKCLASMENGRFSQRAISFPGILLLALHVFSWFDKNID